MRLMMRSMWRRGYAVAAVSAVLASTPACDRKDPAPPAESTAPAEAAKPDEAAKPAEAVKPAEAAKPDDAPNPAEAAKPAEAPTTPVNPSEVKMTTDTPADVAAPPADATVTASGLAYKVLRKVDGAKKPKEWDTVEVHYVGWTTDGKKFDSSLDRGQPTTFPLNRVIAGWTEGVQLIGIGEHARFWIPEKLAYQGQPGAPAGMLVFDVELLSITEGKAPEPAPADVAAPPEDAKRTESGLAWKVLTPGKGGEKPKAENTVTVHYTGWTTDGKMFDSSVQRGQPATFPLNRVIAGWTEGLQLMEVGEKARLWIPEALAYKGQPGRPAGMLVFDVELISFK